MEHFDKKLEPLIKDIADIALHLWNKGWAERNAGNISINITSFMSENIKEKLSDNTLYKLNNAYPELAGHYFLVKCTGIRMRDLSNNPNEGMSIVRISEDCKGYYIVRRDSVASMPTVEFNSHLAIHQLIHKNHLSQKAVLHTHPIELIALTHISEYNDEKKLNHLLWSMHPETKIVISDGIGLVPYQVSGSEELEHGTIKAFHKHRIVLWEKHGSVSIGNDISGAFDLIDTMNKSAQIFFVCKSAGFTPQGLTEAQLNELESIFNNIEK